MTVPASTPVEAVSTIYLFYARYVFGKMEPVMCSYISFDSRAWIVCIIFCLSRNLWTFLWQCDCVLQTYVEIICLPNKYYTRSIANICLKVLLSFSWKDSNIFSELSIFFCIWHCVIMKKLFITDNCLQSDKNHNHSYVIHELKDTLSGLELWYAKILRSLTD